VSTLNKREQMEEALSDLRTWKVACYAAISDRDELLAALQYLVDLYPNGSNPAWGAARAVIAKVQS
jgi:hypothetical protein